MRTLPALLSAVALWGCGSDIELAPDQNLQPAAVIVTPGEGASFTDVMTIDFVGSVADGDGLADIQIWRFDSDIDGTLGEGTEVSIDGAVRVSDALSVGLHTVTLFVQDRAGASSTDAVTIDVQSEEQVPVVDILAPEPAAAIEITEQVEFVGTVFDRQEPAEDLVLEWTLAREGEPGVVLSDEPADLSGTSHVIWRPT